MSGNTFGKLFSVTTFGESHGVAIGGVIDGCPLIASTKPIFKVDLGPSQTGTRVYYQRRTR